MKSPCDICSLHPCTCQRQNSYDASNSASDFAEKEGSPVNLRHNSTPDRRNGVSRYSVNSPLRTIRESPCSKSSNLLSTPLRSYRIATNPFDIEVDSLQTSSFSPSVFAMTKKKSEKTSSFRWSIEQLAVLEPADIDEASQQDIYVDWEKEVKAQKAIDTFFSKNHIVPSPWAPTVKYMSFSPNLASTAYQYSSYFQRSPNADETDSNDNSAAKSVSTQTMITFPPNLDLMTLLGPFCTYQAECRNDSPNRSGSDVDMLSTSSLRRKLFMNDNVDAPPPYENKYEEENSAPKFFTPDKKSVQMLATPASDHFSSSPITPRNFSFSMNYPTSYMSSPNISPIRASSVKSRASEHLAAASDDEDEFLGKCNKDESISSSGMKVEDAGNKMSQQSVVSKSMCDNGTSSFCSREVEFYDPGTAANPEDDENRMSFRDSGSTNRDTGYLTGSLNSAPSMNFQQANSSCGQIRTTPVIELLGTCAITKMQQSCDNMDDSGASSRSMIGEVSSVSTGQSGEAVDPCASEFNLRPWYLNKYSTPSKTERY